MSISTLPRAGVSSASGTLQERFSTLPSTTPHYKQPCRGSASALGALRASARQGYCCAKTVTSYQAGNQHCPSSSAGQEGKPVLKLNCRYWNLCNKSELFAYIIINYFCNAKAFTVGFRQHKNHPVVSLSLPNPTWRSKRIIPEQASTPHHPACPAPAGTHRRSEPQGWKEARAAVTHTRSHRAPWGQLSWALHPSTD